MPLTVLLAGLAPWILMTGLLASSAASTPLDESSGDDPVAVILRVVNPAPEDSYRVGDFVVAGETAPAVDAERVLLLTRTGEVVRLGAGEPVPVQPREGEETDPLFRLLRALLRDGPSLHDDVGTLSVAPSGASPPDAQPSQAPFQHHSPTSSELEGARPLRPAGDRMVRSLTPRMEWEGEEGAMAYRIHLWESDGYLVAMDAGAGSSWVLPPEAALMPGVRYEWAIEPLPGDRIGPRATFVVASREILDEVAQELGKLRQRGLDPEDDGRLAAAAVFRSMGFPYDALDILRELEAAGDPLAPGVRDFHRRLVDELASPETQGSPNL